MVTIILLFFGIKLNLIKSQKRVKLLENAAVVNKIASNHIKQSIYT